MKRLEKLIKSSHRPGDALVLAAGLMLSGQYSSWKIFVFFFALLLLVLRTFIIKIGQEQEMSRAHTLLYYLTFHIVSSEHVPNYFSS